jgi:transcriptional regulator with XRE-family HTH domain
MPIRRTAIAKRRDLLRSVSTELRRLRLDTGLSQRAVARAVGIHHSHIAAIEAGADSPSLRTLARLATALGMDVSIRFYPSAGPRLRDHVQARMVEGVLRSIDPRWRPYLEVAVYRPVRGVVDLALADPSVGQLAVSEHHSELRAADQQLRWAQLKAEAIASARSWPFGLTEDATTDVVRLLFLRNTERNRRTATELAATLATAYPASASATVAVLTGAAGRLPGHAVVWVTVDGTGARLLVAPPRGVSVGR